MQSMDEAKREQQLRQAELMRQARKRAYAQRREVFIEAYKKSFGSITAACRASGLSRSAYYRYMQTNKKFRKAIEELNQSFIELAESKLYQKVLEGDLKAIKFFLVNKAPDRWRSENHIQVAQMVVNQGGEIGEAEKKLQEQLLGELQRRFNI